MFPFYKHEEQKKGIHYNTDELHAITFGCVSVCLELLSWPAFAQRFHGNAG